MATMHRIIRPYKDNFLRPKFQLLNDRGGGRLFSYILQCLGRQYAGEKWVYFSLKLETPRETDKPDAVR